MLRAHVDDLALLLLPCFAVLQLDGLSDLDPGAQINERAVGVHYCGKCLFMDGIAGPALAVNHHANPEEHPLAPSSVPLPLYRFNQTVLSR